MTEDAIRRRAKRHERKINGDSGASPLNTIQSTCHMPNLCPLLAIALVIVTILLSAKVFLLNREKQLLAVVVEGERISNVLEIAQPFYYSQAGETNSWAAFGLNKTPQDNMLYGFKIWGGVYCYVAVDKAGLITHYKWLRT